MLLLVLPRPHPWPAACLCELISIDERANSIQFSSPSIEASAAPSNRSLKRSGRVRVGYIRFRAHIF